MAVPKFAPVPASAGVSSYASPDYVPDPWIANRPAEIHGRQPEGRRLGYQGPDQGYVLVLARRVRPRISVCVGESVDDAVRGSINIALRRASMFGRAPVIHDLNLALTIWGFFDSAPVAELVARRSELFEGLSNTGHHYVEGRVVADLVPQATLRLTPAAAERAYLGGSWRSLTGA